MRISDWSSDVCSSDLRGARLQIFKAVAGNDERLRRLFQPVIGAADPPGQPRRALWRAHLDDAIDVAPVDAEVEACRRDQRAKPAFAHCGFHTPPPPDRKRAVMDPARQIVLVALPHILKEQRKSAVAGTGVASQV